MNAERPFSSVKNLSEHLDIEFALQATGLGVWELDTATGQVIWDDRCRELFGIRAGHNVSYDQAIKQIHPEDIERVNLAVQRAISGDSDGFYDESYRTLGADDGILRWVRFYGRAYFSEQGVLTRFAGICHEITEQKNAEEREIAASDRADRQQRILETISSSTPDLMYVFDLNYRFTYANRALLDMWGTDWENSIGKSLLENGYEPWHAEMHEREIDQVIATRKSIRGEVSFPHATLGRRVYDYVFSPVLNEHGEVEAVAGTTRDITDLIIARQKLEENQAALSSLTMVLEQQVKERTKELEQANALLMSSNANLQNFAYVASHDLQEPLRKIQQFGNLLTARQTSFSESEISYIHRMQSAAGRMSVLIADLLDFASVSTHRQNDEMVDLNAVLEQVLITLELSIAESGAEIEVDRLPQMRGNASQLAQLFQNLLGNALKFRQPAVTPVISVRWQSLEAHQLPAFASPMQPAASYHRIDVADNGIGFDQQYLDRIFQVFQRLHGRNEFSGTGIGLAICERVVANHGGAITASSQPGVGSTFSVFFPA